MRILPFIITVLLALTSGVGTLCAQDDIEEEVILEKPAARQGYWIGGGVSGASNINARKNEDDTGALTGYHVSFRMGELLTSTVGIGLQFGGGPVSNDRFSGGFGGVAMTASWAPWSHLAIHGGVGVGGFGARDSESEDRELIGTGGGYYMAGASYDWFPFWDQSTGGFSFSPRFQVQYLPGNLLEAWVFTLGLETLWWSGLDKNKLDLDVESAY